MKKHIPNIITLLNLLSGILATFFSIYFWQEINNFYLYILVLILLGAIFDFLDGMIARLLKVSSELGKQLDSLSDLITFSIAPVFLLTSIQMFLNNGFSYNILPLFIVPMFAALRLGKFNLLEDTATPYFIGLPTPATAIFITAYSIMILKSQNTLWNSLSSNLILAILISYLMNSKLKVFSLKFSKWNKRTKRYFIIFLILSVIIIIFAGWYSTIPVLIIYFVISHLNYN